MLCWASTEMDARCINLPQGRAGGGWGGTVYSELQCCAASDFDLPVISGVSVSLHVYPESGAA